MFPPPKVTIRIISPVYTCGGGGGGGGAMTELYGVTDKFFAQILRKLDPSLRQ